MFSEWAFLQVNLCQKLLFLHQQYDVRLFIELQVQDMKIPSSNLGRTCCVQKLFLTFRTILVHNMFSPCSAKRRASDKDLPVCASYTTYIFLCLILYIDKGLLVFMGMSHLILYLVTLKKNTHKFVGVLPSWCLLL